jgi:hypothetical protein
MGCSTSKLNEQQKCTNSKNLTITRETAKNNYNRLNSLVKSILTYEDISNSSELSSNTTCEKICNDRKLLEKYKITPKEFQYGYKCIRLMEQKRYFSIYSLSVNHLITDIFYNVTKADNLDELKEKLAKWLHAHGINKMKTMIFGDAAIKSTDYKPLMDIIKYSSETDTKAMGVILSDNLCKNKDIIKDIAEVIEWSTNLTTLLVLYETDYDNCAADMNMDVLLPIFKAMSRNLRIRVFGFMIVGRHNFTLSEETQKVYIDIFKINTKLVMVGLPRFDLSVNNFNLMMNYISKNKGLKGLAIECGKYEEDKVKLFLDATLNNKSLEVVLYYGFENEEQIFEKSNLIKQTDKSLFILNKFIAV